MDMPLHCILNIPLERNRWHQRSAVEVFPLVAAKLVVPIPEAVIIL